ncbi:hypothetical protein [Fibrobacter intestinalis]|uniref:hypothetical protein n=1 Tax=Fibrobacter intestinalis TaxID=28122 RepID=UPI0013567024|nr:hypothetical protein [Fibrobacter intestinalis]MEE0877045.1 hypothetical protein [Fibrobacteraceae bacterium]
MHKILFFLLIISIHSFALTLDQVRADLKKNSISGDSIELSVRVNAAGLPMATLFNGTWNEGEHSVNVSDFSLSAGCYLVLRRGSRILTWQLLK